MGIVFDKEPSEDDIINRIESLKSSRAAFNREVDTMLFELREKRIEIIKAKYGEISEEEARTIRWQNSAV